MQCQVINIPQIMIRQELNPPNKSQVMKRLREYSVVRDVNPLRGVNPNCHGMVKPECWAYQSGEISYYFNYYRMHASNKNMLHMAF